MKADKQNKIPDSRLIQPKKNHEKKNFIDNRSQAIEQSELINMMQQKKEREDFMHNDDFFCFPSANVLQRNMEHVKKLGCFEAEASSANFKLHMFTEGVDYSEISAIRGAQHHTVIQITDKQLAEEVAADLYTWPDDWEPEDKIYITSKAQYNSITYYDGKVDSEQTSKIKVRCQLKKRKDGTMFYQVYHFSSLV